jgi:hypothetical protein
MRDEDDSDDSDADEISGKVAGINFNTSSELTEADFDTVNHESFRKNKDRTELENIFNAYASTRKAAKELKTEELCRFFMDHGGINFWATWRLYVMDIISTRLTIPIHRKIWSCESRWSADRIIEKCKLQPDELEGVELQKEVQKAKKKHK